MNTEYLNEFLEKLVITIKKNIPDTINLNPFFGVSGANIFLFMAANYLGKPKYYNVSEEILLKWFSSIFDNHNKSVNKFELVGACLALDVMSKSGFIDIENRKDLTSMNIAVDEQIIFNCTRHTSILIDYLLLKLEFETSSTVKLKVEEQLIYILVSIADKYSHFANSKVESDVINIANVQNFNEEIFYSMKAINKIKNANVNVIYSDRILNRVFQKKMHLFSEARTALSDKELSYNLNGFKEKFIKYADFYYFLLKIEVADSRQKLRKFESEFISNCKRYLEGNGFAGKRENDFNFLDLLKNLKVIRGINQHLQNDLIRELIVEQTCLLAKRIVNRGIEKMFKSDTSIVNIGIDGIAGLGLFVLSQVDAINYENSIPYFFDV